jgi:hypothetical protein
MKRTCRHEDCKVVFDDTDIAKKESGGLIDECPDCSDDRVVKYLGVRNASGKMGGVEILKFSNKSDREKFNRAWQHNTGLHKGKSCQVSNPSTIGNGVSFTKVAAFGGNQNHKGRAD